VGHDHLQPQAYCQWLRYLLPLEEHLLRAKLQPWHRLLHRQPSGMTMEQGAAWTVAVEVVGPGPVVLVGG